SANSFECTNFDKILLLFRDGSYKVINPPEKLYVNHDGKKVAHVGVADKKSIISIVYKDPKNCICYAKRFIVNQFILEKEYSYMDKGMVLELLTLAPELQIELQYIPKARQKAHKQPFNIHNFLVKGVSAQGVRISSKPVKKIVTLIKK